MLDFIGKSGEQLKAFFGGWPTFIAVGTFFLYLTGYLSTRFYLTLLGVGADLAVLDENYFFAGAKFLVYLVSTIPILTAIVLIIAAIIWLLKRIFRSRPKNLASPLEPGKFSLRSSTLLSIIGIIFALLLIQLVMRQSYFLSNVLVSETFPTTELGFERLLLDEDDNRTSFYFMGLVAATIITIAIWLFARSLPHNNWFSRSALFLLGFLIIIEFLFLPINYGVFVQGRYLPRVTDLGDQVPLKAGQNAWLVWEGKNTFTYLVEEAPKPVETPTPTPTPTPSPSPSRKCKKAASPTPTPSPSPTVEAIKPTSQSQPAPFGRKLISIPQKDLKQITIIKYDPIMRHIFFH